MSKQDRDQLQAIESLLGAALVLLAELKKRQEARQ